MKIQPLDDRVVIKPLEAEEKTAGGIVIPDTAKEKPAKGKVLSIGPGKLLENGNRAELSVKKNDVVVYSKYAGNEVKIDGDELIIMRESDILGIIE
jgi:chaperonin GroES